MCYTYKKWAYFSQFCTTLYMHTHVSVCCKTVVELFLAQPDDVFSCRLRSWGSSSTGPWEVNKASAQCSNQGGKKIENKINNGGAFLYLSISPPIMPRLCRMCSSCIFSVYCLLSIWQNRLVLFLTGVSVSISISKLVVWQLFHITVTQSIHLDLTSIFFQLAHASMWLRIGLWLLSNCP